MDASAPHNLPAAVPETRTLSLHVRQHPMSILLVDDDADCRMLIRDAIGERADTYVIYEACNGVEALDLLSRKGGPDQDELPGLIFMDVEMPILGGLDTLKRIKSDPRLKHIPIVMMTGVSDEEHMLKAAEYGANSYTLKPADADHFLTTVAASTAYWLSVHQYPQQRLPQSQCRR